MNENKSNDILLRDVREDDLPIFFEQQLDPDANYMAGFSAKDPKDRDSFSEKWKKILADKTIVIKAIIFKGNVSGHIASHKWFGEPEVTYWIGKEYWGKGIASVALADFLNHVEERPLYGRVANDNAASIRVLEKCGFKFDGKDKGFANAREEEIEEFIYKLDVKT